MDACFALSTLHDVATPPLVSSAPKTKESKKKKSELLRLSIDHKILSMQTALLGHQCCLFLPLYSALFEKKTNADIFFTIIFIASFFFLVWGFHFTMPTYR